MGLLLLLVYFFLIVLLLVGFVMLGIQIFWLTKFLKSTDFSRISVVVLRCRIWFVVCVVSSVVLIIMNLWFIGTLIQGLHTYFLS